MLKRFLLIALLFLMLPLTVAAETIEKYTAKMERIDGYYTMYIDKNADKVFVVVPKKSEPFIFQSSLPRGVGSNDLGLDRGQLGSTRLVEFSVHGPRVLLTEKNTRFVALTDNPAEKLSVQEAFAESVLFGFEVKASTEEAVLIDYTPFLMTDIHNLSDTLKWQKEGNFSVDTSRSILWLDRTKSFPNNTELEAKLTYKGTNAGRYVRSVTPEQSAITVHTHHSFIKLPDDGYQPRAFHPNSGYYARGFKDYAAPLGESMNHQFISRHRLEKKNPQAARSEAVEPIVYYLDPGVPEPMRSALLDGARWWNEAFEAIGYINAFQVKELPANADPMDVRYNVIQWVHRATRGWSYGYSVVDPRTGEIIKGHVTLGSLRVRQDMLLAQGMLPPYEEGADTQGRLQAIEDMAISRIRQLSAHEIGHTLGIAHNFAASPLDRSSVMDYPTPMAELKENGEISLERAYAVGMGPWDKFTIAYGYTQFDSPEAEEQGLKQLLRDAANKGLDYISDRDTRTDGGGHPSSHLWDNGENPSTELMRIAELRQRVLANFGTHNLAPGRPLDELEHVLVPMYLMHRYQIDAAVKLIGGMHYWYYVNGESEVDYRPVAAKAQEEARQAILNTLSVDFLTLPRHVQALIVPKAMGSSVSREDFASRMGIFNDPVTMAEASANHSLKMYLHSERLNRVYWQHQQDSAIAGPDMLVADLIKHTFTGLKTSKDAIAQRVAYLTAFQLGKALQSEATAPEVRAVLRGQLVDLQQSLAKSSSSRRYESSAFAAHLAYCIDELLNNGNWPESFTPVAMPPGSPI